MSKVSIMKTIRFREYDDFSPSLFLEQRKQQQQQQQQQLKHQPCQSQQQLKLQENSSSSFQNDVTSNKRNDHYATASSSTTLSLSSSSSSSHDRQQREQGYQYRECILPLPPQRKRTQKNSNNNNNNQNNQDENKKEHQKDIVFLSWKTVSTNNNDDNNSNDNSNHNSNKINSNENDKNKSNNSIFNRTINTLGKIDVQKLLIFKNKWKYKVHKVATDLFLPVGYPNSVNDGYIQYQFYDSLQGLCSYLRGVVSTSAVLTAAGVGDSEATALSAAVHWATKDGCGMIGGLLFSYYSSSHFDSHIKEFRLFADIINDVGLTLDMIAPYVPKSYLLSVSITATLCRTLCGIAAGATKGCITQHFANDNNNNIADLNAKEGTQETLVSFIGMIFGIVLARMIQSMEEQCTIIKNDSMPPSLSSTLYGHSATIATWYIFISLTSIHVWANYVGVKVLRLRSLNRQRAEVALYNIIQKSVELVKEDMQKVKSDKIATKMKLIDFKERAVILSPSECNESLWGSVQKMIFPGMVNLGVRLSNCLNDMTREEVLAYIGILFRNKKYILLINNARVGSSFQINVVLRIGASHDDELEAFVHAMVVQECMKGKLLKKKDSQMQLIIRSKKCVDLLFSTNTLSLKKLTDSGWDRKLLLGFGRSRATWTDVKIERTIATNANETKKSNENNSA